VDSSQEEASGAVHTASHVAEQARKPVTTQHRVDVKAILLHVPGVLVCLSLCMAYERYYAHREEHFAAAANTLHLSCFCIEATTAVVVMCGAVCLCRRCWAVGARLALCMGWYALGRWLLAVSLST
jgi:hypothetical protein